MKLAYSAGDAKIKNARRKEFNDQKYKTDYDYYEKVLSELVVDTMAKVKQGMLPDTISAILAESDKKWRSICATYRKRSKVLDIQNDAFEKVMAVAYQQAYAANTEIADGTKS